jgi:hypothetical protein
LTTAIHEEEIAGKKDHTAKNSGKDMLNSVLSGVAK